MSCIVKVFLLTAMLFIASLPAHGCGVDLHSRYSMTYAGNQLSRMEIEREGEDYEGRTGVGATGTVTNFWYDVNGNMGRDMSRGIMETRYNRLNLPTDVYFSNGHRQTITYDGFGQKRQVSYSQTDDPMLGAMMGVPEDSAYTLQGRRSYLGPHVFVNDSLEYSAFPGGYFTPKGTYYYIADWQGNNIAVFSDKGRLEQQATYYPYGEPTVEPAGQRYLFGGKEREHAGGYNAHNYGPRCLTPTGSWSAADKMSESFYPLSPFSYCGGDPINRVDRDGKFWDTLWDVGNILLDAGCAIKAHIDGDHDKAKEYWKDAAYDTGAAIIPFVPAGGSKLAKLFKSSESVAETAIDASSGMKYADRIKEGKAFERAELQKAIERGDDVASQITLVPLNGNGNIKGNCTRVDQLKRDKNGKFIIVENKLTDTTPLSKGQRAAKNHIGETGGWFEVRTDAIDFGLRQNDVIFINKYERINKYTH